jgi:hypothetical protein
MNQSVEEGSTFTICPHCHKDLSGRALIIYLPTSAGDDWSVWHCQECKGEWPREPARTEQER